MKKPLVWTAAGVAALAAGLAGAQTYSTYPAYGYGYDNAQVRVVRCESVDSRRNFCRIDTRGGVQISRQLSRQACVRGRNWRVTRDGIAVADGCRADFVVNTGMGGGRYQATTGYYTTDRYGRRVYVQGYTTTPGVYTPGRDAYPMDGYSRTGYYGDNRTIHCQGTGHGRTYCGVRGSHYALVDRSPSCIADRTVGDDAYGTWVSGSCNADFALRTYPVDQGYYDPADAVYERNRDTTPYGYAAPTYDGTRTVYCQASPSGRTYCGDREQAYSMRYDTNAYCVEGVTYGRDSYGTWVSGGCNLTLEPEYEQ